jgi:Undecaprenyl-phosphate glucose phosphotransferase
MPFQSAAHQHASAKTLATRRDETMTNIHVPVRAGMRSAWALSYDAITPAVMLSDIAAITAAGIGTGIAYHLFFTGSQGDVQQFFSLAALVIALTVPMLHFRGHYRAQRLVFGHTSVGEIASTWIGVFLFLSALPFGLKNGAAFSRGWIASFFVVGAGILVAQRLIWEAYLGRAAAAGSIRPKKAALLGNATVLEQGTRENDLTSRGFAVTHRIFLAAQNGESAPTDFTAQRLETLLKSFRGSDIDEILVVGGWPVWLQIRSSLKALRAVPFRVRLVPDDSLADLLTRQVSPIGDLPALELQAAPLTTAALKFKRFMDVAISLTGLLVFSPILAAAAIAIRIETPGMPVVFQQTRTGFNGRLFRIYKLRTMRVVEDGDTIYQVKRGDPRVTTVGRFLRRTSIDELPQPLNVLKGDMSLIGPRPIAAAQDDHYERLLGEYAYRQHVKPGITGWAQVNGCRGETPSLESMARRLHLDHWYIANWSLWLDTKILMLTVVALITNRDVY